MNKAKKLNGVPSVMVPVETFLELARAYSRDYPGKRYVVGMAALEAKAYRKLRESAPDQ